MSYNQLLWSSVTPQQSTFTLMYCQSIGRHIIHMRYNKIIWWKTRSNQTTHGNLTIFNMLFKTCIAISKILVFFSVIKWDFFVFNFSAGIFRDILIQRHSTSTLYFKCAPTCLISLRYIDRLTLLLLLYEDSSLVYTQGSVTQNILLSSGRLYYSSMCLFSFFISCSKNHSRAVYKKKNTVHLSNLPF